jgi:diguanylate cyclase
MSSTPTLSAPLPLTRQRPADRQNRDQVALDRSEVLDTLELLVSEHRASDRTLGVLVVRLCVSGCVDLDLEPALETVLCDVTHARLHASLRECDKFGALAHDEWVVMLPRLSGPEQLELAAMKIVRAFEPPLAYGNENRRVRAAIGVASTNMPSRSLLSARTLVRTARVAAQQALTRQDDYLVYDAEQGADDDSDRALEVSLRKALNENALALHYQPQVLFATGKVTSCEALARWTTGNGEHISPGEFIPVAERRGLMPQFTHWALNTGLRQAQAFRASGNPLAISLNVSPLNLREPDFPDVVAQCLEMWSIPANQVTLELTESAPMHGKTYLPMLKRLKAIGVDLAIDDFGTGYSSLALLPDLPVDELKIDQRFIRTMLTEEGNLQIVRTVLALARNFGLRTVAEGIEDKATFEALGELGCTLAQGYFVGRPMPAPAFSGWLGERAARGSGQR